MATHKWVVQGYRGNQSTFKDEVTAGESQIRTLLERLASRHLTEREIVECTLGTSDHLEVSRSTGGPSYTLTTGSDFWYTAAAKN